LLVLTCNAADGHPDLLDSVSMDATSDVTLFMDVNIRDAHKS